MDKQYLGRMLLITTITFVPAFADDSPAAPMSSIRDAAVAPAHVTGPAALGCDPCVRAPICGECDTRRREAKARDALLGWQLSDRWSLGKYRAGDRSVGLIWRERNAQVTLNHDGIRWSRRF